MAGKWSTSRNGNLRYSVNRENQSGIYIGPTKGLSSPKNSRQGCLCLDKDTYHINKFNLQIDHKQISLILDEISRNTSERTDTLFKKGFFYMNTHLIRAIPYLYKKNPDLALYASLLSVYYLSL